MTLNEYQHLAQRTSGPGHDRLLNGCLGLIGESGEIVDIIKKHMFQSTAGTPLPTDKLIEEMGDVMWYIAETVTGLGYTLEHVLESHKITSVSCEDKLHNCAAAISIMAATVYSIIYFRIPGESALSHIVKLYKALCITCLNLGTTIDHVMEFNIEKLKRRYPDGFDPERSMNRPEYQRKEEPEQTGKILFSERNKLV